MNLKKIEAFFLVIEWQSFSKAAQYSGRSQPSISQQIRGLESDLDVDLLDRSSPVVTPTPAGKYVYRMGKNLLEQWDQMQREVHHFQDVLTGTLHIGASTIPDAYLLPRWLAAFHRRYRQVALTTMSGDSKDVFSQLRNRQVQVAITAAKPYDTEEIECHPVARDSLVLIAPTDYPVKEDEKRTPPEWVDDDFVIREEGAGTRESLNSVLAQWQMQVANLHVTAQVGSTEALISSVEQGLGISLVSQLAVQDAIAAGRLQQIRVVEPLSQKFYLCYLKNQRSHPLIQAFSAVVFAETQSC